MFLLSSSRVKGQTDSPLKLEKLWETFSEISKEILRFAILKLLKKYLKASIIAGEKIYIFPNAQPWSAQGSIQKFQFSGSL